MEKEKINLCDIDLEDTKYLITSDFNNLDAFEKSIKSIGLINPPFLECLENSSNYKYRIVSGFKRIKICKNLNIKETDAKILTCSELERVLIAICDNNFQRKLNLIEQSRAFYLLSKYCQNSQEIIKNLEILGFEPNLDLFEKIKKIYFMPKKVQSFILTETISLVIALELSVFEHNEFILLADIFNNLNLSFSNQKELIILLKEISIREDISILSILNNIDLQKVLNNKDLNRNEKANQIRAYLKAIRYPEITRFTRLFEDNLKAFNLPKEIKLNCNFNNFESKNYSISFNFKNFKEFEKNKQKFYDLLDNLEFRRNFENLMRNY